MRTRDWAERIVTAPSIELKLAPPESALDDSDPGPALRLTSPARPERLRIVPAREARVPAIRGLQDPRQKPRILHALANHELQALELFAWALLAFPDCPPAFRSGLVRVLRDEQMHCRLYMRRLRRLGHELGDFPVSGYFWGKVPAIDSPAAFVCAMSLTFENANLDHSAAYADEARAIDDDETAELLDRIHHDEIGHVRFGWEWLERFKAPDQTMSEAYLANTRWPLRPALARGEILLVEPRIAAGLDEGFIRMLAGADGYRR